MTRIIALCGFTGVGKDTVARVMCEQHGFARAAFADPMRAMLLALDPIIPLGWQDANGGGYERLSSLLHGADSVSFDTAKRKYPEVRRLLQRLGTEAGREVLGDDIWIRLAMEKIAGRAKVVVTDLRFENEYQALYNRNAVFVHVTRPEHGPINNHQSEQLDYARIADYIIANDGTTDDLMQKVIDLMREPLPERLVGRPQPIPPPDRYSDHVW